MPPAPSSPRPPDRETSSESASQTASAPKPSEKPAREPVAVILVSGGLDSAVTLAIALEAGYRPVALTFDYGQRHRCELQAAVRVAAAAGNVEHRIARIDLRAFGGSALTADIDVPKDRPEGREAAAPGAPGTSDIPITYVPARNTIFLSFALALAEVSGAEAIFLGINAVDYCGYPDCRPEFLDAYQRMADLATRAGVEGTGPRIEAPLMHLSKADIIRRGRALNVDLSLTISCYDPAPDGTPCRHCDACLIRIAAEREVG